MSQNCDCTCTEKKTMMVPLSNIGLGFYACAQPLDLSQNCNQNQCCEPAQGSGQGLSQDEVRQMIEDALAARPALDNCCAVLAENLNLYVAPDGDDANNGLTPEAPFKTVQAALESTCHYVSGGPDAGITIILASGDYVGEPVKIDFTRHFPVLTLQGQADQSSRIIGGIDAKYSGNLILRDLYSESQNGGFQYALHIANGVYCELFNVHMCGNTADARVIEAYNGSVVIIHTPLTFSTKHKAFTLFMAHFGFIDLRAKVKLLDCDATYTLESLAQGYIRLRYEDGAAWEGTCTGSRYLVFTGGVISTHGYADSLIPGKSAGVVNPGGVYW